mmetsp:Transcript_69032/g.144126  ORF Transcript_69032/g.144126 Transcript_69032/m.144126 type:complete len:220 (+) Transcript_69032:1566-2225(+)
MTICTALSLFIPARDLICNSVELAEGELLHSLLCCLEVLCEAFQPRDGVSFQSVQFLVAFLNEVRQFFAAPPQLAVHIFLQVLRVVFNARNHGLHMRHPLLDFCHSSTHLSHGVAVARGHLRNGRSCVLHRLDRLRALLHLQILIPFQFHKLDSAAVCHGGLSQGVGGFRKFFLQSLQLLRKALLRGFEARGANEGFEDAGDGLFIFEHICLLLGLFSV